MKEHPMIHLNLDKEKRYLLACSFGPDSMALFHLLVKNKYNFACAIVNYHLRDESDSEVINLKKYAAEYNIEVYSFDVKEKITKNVEATCREIRYKFFKEVCAQFHFDALLVAHHQDDLIETYLMQKERQNNPIFFGISKETKIYGVTVIRPVITFKKSDLLKICEENNVPYSIDKTNFDISIMRNRIRHNVVSKMLDREREEIINEINLENEKLSQMFSSLNINKLCEVNYVLSLDFTTQCYALNYLVKNINPTFSLSKKNVGQIIKILRSNKPNGQFVIYKGLYLFKEYDLFEFGVNKVEQKEFKYTVLCPCILSTPYFYLNFKQDTSDRNVDFDDYPLTIRNVKKKDFIMINGYKAEAQRLLIDWKVPFRKRMYWPVILNKNGEVIYIPRYRKDFQMSEKLSFYVK